MYGSSDSVAFFKQQLDGLFNVFETNSNNKI